LICGCLSILGWIWGVWPEKVEGLVIASCYYGDWVGEARWESVKNNGSMIER
jgi:hypothetical protein